VTHLSALSVREGQDSGHAPDRQSCHNLVFSDINFQDYSSCAPPGALGGTGAGVASGEELEPKI